MNAMTPIADFRTAYAQLERLERVFVDGYVKDIEEIADKTGQRLRAVLHAPYPYGLDQRAVAMLARPMVRAAISERIDTLSSFYDISIGRTLKGFACIAYSNIADYITINTMDGTPEIDLSKCTPEMMAAVKSFEIEDKPRGGRKYKFQLHDKLGALGYLGKYQGLFADDNPHWRNQELSTAPNRVSTLPADVSEDAAALMYSREING